MSLENSSRRGAAMITVLVVIGLISATLLISVQQSLQLFRQQRREADARQAQWLAEAGVERGLRAIANGENYSGETWEVSIPISTSMREAGQAEILLVRGKGAKIPDRLIVTARFPTDPLHGVRHEIEILLPLQKRAIP